MVLTKLAESDGADWPRAEPRVRNKFDPSLRDAPRPKNRNNLKIVKFSKTDTFSDSDIKKLLGLQIYFGDYTFNVLHSNMLNNFQNFLRRYANALSTCSDGLGKAACEKSLGMWKIFVQSEGAICFTITTCDDNAREPSIRHFWDIISARY